MKAHGLRWSLVVFASMLVACHGRLANAPPRVADERPLDVILLIGDGMGFNQLMLAQLTTGRRLAMESMPVTGIIHTAPAEGLVTDSAAAATALATGKKTRVGMVGVTPDGRPARSILEEMHGAGAAIGFVTSGTLVGATPAGFLAHVASRDDERAIAQAIAASGADVLAGASAGFDALDEAQRRGFTVVHGAEFLTAGRTPVLAFLDGLDGDPAFASEPAGISLAQAATQAVTLLRKRGPRYLLVVEDDGIDSGAHDHDAARTTAQLIALDRAVAAALEIAREDGRTLVLVTADHETGGLHLTGGSSASDVKLAWATDDHTAGPVPIFAYGPGAAAFAGVLDNTEVHSRLRRLLID